MLELAALKNLVPWQWEDWQDPYERGLPLCEVRQDHLRSLLNELEEWRRGGGEQLAHGS